MRRTSEFPYFQCSFKFFNPVQEQSYDKFDKDFNFVIASTMSSGKTAIAECVIGYEISKGGHVCYISPLKSLSKEKHTSWIVNDNFIDKKIVLMTGDDNTKDYYAAQADILIATIESFDVRLRKRSEWLERLKCLVIDEAHLLGSGDRGASIESVLMSFTKINPTCRIILLSGTLSNAKEIALWVKSLNGKQTSFVKSEWAPVKVEKKVVTYKFFDAMLDKIKKRMLALEYGQKALVFVHSKKVGRKAEKFLKRNMIDCRFYHSSLSPNKREEIINEFKSGSVNVLISTSALGMGVNIE